MSYSLTFSSAKADYHYYVLSSPTGSSLIMLHTEHINNSWCVPSHISYCLGTRQQVNARNTQKNTRQESENSEAINDHNTPSACPWSIFFFPLFNCHNRDGWWTWSPMAKGCLASSSETLQPYVGNGIFPSFWQKRQQRHRTGLKQ